MHSFEFPNLGIYFELNPQLFTVGPFTVHWYGVIMALTFLIVITGIIWKGPKYGLVQDDLVDLILIITPVAILGARIFYVLVNWDYYAANLSEIYKIWHGGLAIYGGIILGIIAIFLFCRLRKINPLKLLDHIVVYLALGQVIGRWGNFINQELFGPNTNLPWGMTGDIIRSTILQEQYPGVDPTRMVHPLFLYESVWNLAAFFLLSVFRKRKKLEGEVFTLYMISYGCARFAIDSLRFDLMVGEVNINRFIGILFAIAFAVIFVIRRSRLKKKVQEAESYEPSQYREVINMMEDISAPSAVTEGVGEKPVEENAGSAEVQKEEEAENQRQGEAGPAQKTEDSEPNSNTKDASERE